MVLQSPMVFAARTTEAEGADVKGQAHVKSDPVVQFRACSSTSLEMVTRAQSAEPESVNGLTAHAEALSKSVVAGNVTNTGTASAYLGRYAGLGDAGQRGGLIGSDHEHGAHESETVQVELGIPRHF
ncbi:hypothetical protein EHS25_008077 [Saitozyma podzolica]|uniref:Uncharacterized protein n=1 Tax=Saitozyma podzolica TaxID=1890683 RepID=A0A427YND2_9TREE|nr:hypothetical protein EHS25_008077 [Saitozyma podzolica]